LRSAQCRRSGWIRGSFAEASVEVHQLMSQRDFAMVWTKPTGTHIVSPLLGLVESRRLERGML
jgi:hypothetical protein